MPASGSFSLVRCSRRSGALVFLALGMDELVEIAHLPTGGFLLEKKFQVVFVKFREELIPGDLAKLRIVPVACLGELESEDARLFAALGPSHFAWNCVSRFGPPANFFVILRGFRRWHGIPFARSPPTDSACESGVVSMLPPVRQTQGGIRFRG